MRTAIIVYILLACASLEARPKIDVLLMKNGDRFTCEIKKLENGVLYAGLDYVDGTLSIDWAQVARVESSQLFLVYTQDGSVYKGTLKTALRAGDEPMKIEIADAEERPAAVERREIVGVGQTSVSFWRRFSGSVDSGLIYSRGNNTTQYNLASQVAFRRERWMADSNYSSSFSKSTGVTASTRNQLDLKALHLLRRSNWFYAGTGNFLQSSQQGIATQMTLGGGLGRFLKNTNRARIYLVGGLAWQNTVYESTDSPQGPQKALSAMIGGGVEAFRFKKTSLNLTAALLPVLTQAGRVRSSVNAMYSIQIISNLWWKFTFYGNWDNRPPASFSGSDYGASSGLSWTFN
jgi:hypothetical protein